MKCEECKKELTGKSYYNMQSQVELCDDCYSGFFTPQIVAFHQEETPVMVIKSHDEEVLKFCTNGDIFIYGKLADNDKEVVDGFKHFLQGQGLYKNQELDAYNESKFLFGITAGILIGATFIQLFFVPFLLSGIISILICFGGLAYLKWALGKIKKQLW